MLHSLSSPGWLLIEMLCTIPWGDYLHAYERSWHRMKCLKVIDFALSVCVSVYLWWWLYSYVCIYACLCAGHRIASGISSSALCCIWWVRISCRTYRFPFQLYWLAINNREPCLLHWSCKSSVIPSFYVDAGDTNSVPQAFLASLLPTHPSLQSPF